MLRTGPAPRDPTTAGGGSRRVRAWSSLRVRVLVAVAVLVLVALAGTIAGTRWLMDREVDARIQQRLLREVEQLRTLASDGDDPATGQPFGDDAGRLLTVFVGEHVPEPGDVLVAWLGGEQVARSGNVAASVFGEAPLASSPPVVTDTVRDRVQTAAGPLEYLVVPVRSGDADDAVVLTGVLRSAVTDQVERTVAVVALASSLALLVAAALALGLVGWVLRPIRRMREAATVADLADRPLSTRFGTGHEDGELGELAAVVDDLHARLDATVSDRRRSLEAAGSELRLRTEGIRERLIELDGNPEPAVLDVVRDLAGVEVDRVDRVADDLALLADRDEPTFVEAAPIDLEDLTAAALRRMETLSGLHLWQLDEVGTGMVLGDRQRLVQALERLGREAVRVTPPNGTVRLGSAVAPGEARLWVTTDAWSPRRRAATDAPVRVDGGGTVAADLGRTIVTAIAEAHGGTARWGSGHDGGLRAELTLPQPRSVGGSGDPVGARRSGRSPGHPR